MIYTVTLNPAIDKTIYIDQLNQDDVTRVIKSIKDAAGKGINVSKALKTLGTNSLATGMTAGNNGKFIKNSLEALTIDYDFIDVLGETRENMKLIEISTNKTLEINELGPKVSETDLNRLISNLKKRIKKEDIIILSGSLPKDLSQNTYYKLIKTFKTLGVITVLDASGEAFNVALKALPTIIKPNIFELRSALNEPLTDESSIVKSLKKLVNSGIELALCTLGKDGALAVSKSDVYKIHPLNLKANSTVGAGDAFISGLCYKLETNASLLEALKYASAVASSAVLTENTSIGSKTIIDKLYQQIKITNLREEENLC